MCAALVLSASPALSAAAPSPATQAQAAQIKTAWVRWLPGGVPLAGYAILANISGQSIVLTSATSTAFQDVSLHQTVQAGGTVRMSPLDRIAIAPHATLDFEARGIHLMLMQPRATLDPNGAVSIALHFADGSSITVPFQVRSSGRGITSRMTPARTAMQCASDDLRECCRSVVKSAGAAGGVT